MLEPHARTLLFDVLRPPENHSLDFAVATTFTLDLLALLTAPVAFTLFEADDHRELLKLNSLTLLESLRRYADRLTVFTHGGMIALPKLHFPQMEFLERVIVQCKVPNDAGVFHPKVWVLRFLGPNETVRYRFACLSRNLTFDRCWDTVLTLEGPRTDRKNAFATNHPLTDFIAALPRMCIGGAPPVVADRVELLQAELRRVDFELPEGFSRYRFHPLGLGGRRSLPFDDVPGRLFAISPFVSEDGLSRIFRGRPGSILVSREESLADGRCRAHEIQRYYTMHDTLQTEEAAEAEEEPPTARGLHAKCYVAESGRNAHVWTGSANATGAAFNGNIEFLVELVGPKSKFGIDLLFEKVEGRPGFGAMLEEFDPAKVVESPEPGGDGFANALAKVRAAVVGNLQAVVTPKESGYALNVSSGSELAIPEGMKVVAWPVSLGAGHARSVVTGQLSHSFDVAFESITSFIAFRVEQHEGDERLEETFVVNVPLSGAPADRRERLLRAAIQDRDRFIRYLLLLLADEGIDLADQMAKSDRQHGGGDSQTAEAGNAGLLESLLRTLDRDPERLDHIARLVTDLRTQGDGGRVMPENFDEVWAPIWAARERSRRA